MSMILGLYLEAQQRGQLADEMEEIPLRERVWWAFSGMCPLLDSLCRLVWEQRVYLSTRTLAAKEGFPWREPKLFRGELPDGERLHGPLFKLVERVCTPRRL